jgi:hypothetical protein
MSAFISPFFSSITYVKKRSISGSHSYNSHPCRKYGININGVWKAWYSSRSIKYYSSSSSLSLTPEQKAAICDPNNPESKLNPVNTTESKICGIPVTIKPPPSNTTSAGTETSSGSLAPSVVPSPEG